jgi:hypothetical protein
MTNETKQTTGADLMRKIYAGARIIAANGKQLTDWYLRAYDPETVFYYKETAQGTLKIWRTKILNNGKRN